MAVKVAINGFGRIGWSYWPSGFPSDVHSRGF